MKWLASNLGAGSAIPGLLEVVDFLNPGNEIPVGALGQRWLCTFSSGLYVEGEVYESDGAATWTVVAGIPTTNVLFVGRYSGALVYRFVHPTQGAKVAIASDGFSLGAIDAVNVVSPVDILVQTGEGGFGATADATSTRTAQFEIEIVGPGEIGVATFQWSANGGVPTGPIVTGALVPITFGGTGKVNFIFTDGGGVPADSFKIGDKWSVYAIQQVDMPAGANSCVGIFNLLTPPGEEEIGIGFASLGSMKDGILWCRGPAPVGGFTAGNLDFFAEVSAGVYAQVGIRPPLGGIVPFRNGSLADTVDGKVAIRYLGV